MEPRIIPLFPLNVVLFPGMVLPLRIFEPRYRLMMRRLLEGDRQFGVVLIRDGDETGAPALPHAVGTVAEINKHERMPNGQMMVVSVGVRRFRIVRTLEGEPYQQAEIEYIEEGDPADPLPEGLQELATAALDRYLEGLAAVTNLTVSLPEEQLSAIDLSYLIAASVQVDNDQKQELLETIPVDARLKRALSVMQRESDRIDAFITKWRSRGDFFYRGFRLSLN